MKDFDPKDVVIVAKKNQNRRGRPVKELIAGYIAYKNKNSASVYLSFAKDFANKYTAIEGYGFNIGKWNELLVLVYQDGGWKVTVKKDGRRYCLYFEIEMKQEIKDFLDGLQKQRVVGKMLDENHILLEKRSDK